MRKRFADYIKENQECKNSAEIVADSYSKTLDQYIYDLEHNMQYGDEFTINIFDNKPLKGGIPAKEKKIKIKDKAAILFIEKKFERLDIKTDV